MGRLGRRPLGFAAFNLPRTHPHERVPITHARALFQRGLTRTRAGPRLSVGVTRIRPSNRTERGCASSPAQAGEATPRSLDRRDERWITRPRRPAFGRTLDHYTLTGSSASGRSPSGRAARQTPRHGATSRVLRCWVHPGGARAPRRKASGVLTNTCSDPRPPDTKSLRRVFASYARLTRARRGVPRPLLSWR